MTGATARSGKRRTLRTRRGAVGEPRRPKRLADIIKEIRETQPELSDEIVEAIALKVLKGRKRVRDMRSVSSESTGVRKVATITASTLRVAGLMASRYMDRGGRIDADRIADAFRMSKGQLAETTGLPAATLSKSDRSAGPKAQGRMTEMLEIISRISEWAGGEAQAMAWYRSQPIPALDGRTPEALVKSGRAAAVRDYLDHLALGGFA